MAQSVPPGSEGGALAPPSGRQQGLRDVQPLTEAENSFRVGCWLSSTREGRHPAGL